MISLIKLFMISSSVFALQAPFFSSLLSTKRIKDFGTYRAYNSGAYPKSCNEYKTSKVGPYLGATGDGTYRIQPASSPVDVYCDMTTDGGGWTLFHSRTITDGKSANTLTTIASKEFLAKYTGMIYYNHYGPSRDTHQIFDVFILGIPKTCYSSWHNVTDTKTNAVPTNGTPAYNYYKPSCNWGSSEYATPTPGYYKNTFVNDIPVGTRIYFGDYKNISGDTSWNGGGFTGSQSFDIFYR